MGVWIKVKNEIISFKGSTEGISLTIKGKEMEEIKEVLDKKLKKSPDFYKGMKFLGIVAEELDETQILDLSLLLKYKYGMNISLGDITLRLNQEYHRKEIKKLDNLDPLEGNGDYPTKFVYGTLRSGQEVDYNGNIVVVGDVNPGGQLKAKGNIIVLGSLKGIAQAGLDGNTGSIVAAYSLNPNQLRIAHLIVRAPDEESWQSKLPEIAKIINDEIIIEPYLPNK